MKNIDNGKPEKVEESIQILCEFLRVPIPHDDGLGKNHKKRREERRKGGREEEEVTNKLRMNYLSSINLVIYFIFNNLTEEEKRELQTEYNKIIEQFGDGKSFSSSEWPFLSYQEKVLRIGELEKSIQEFLNKYKCIGFKKAQQPN